MWEAALGGILGSIFSRKRLFSQQQQVVRQQREALHKQWAQLAAQQLGNPNISSMSISGWQGASYSAGPGKEALVKAAAKAATKGKNPPKALEPYVKEFKRTLRKFVETAEPEAFVEASRLFDRIRRDSVEGRVSPELKREGVMSKLKVKSEPASQND
jgi:hypothetical protein